ncbi:uncharacterized protein LOC106761120 [Vigna radiata var. radiata]|uniref:Uncharacterized protein LOC106761120 n=1 Tax=Vigna radiata var. radiata TaxID=3916 RepID=A0A1S3U273_VIGRR|nr:uncharacterized protein LOC106761120 [Vigna radiata var. radiata]
MSGGLVPPVRVVRCPKCRLLLQEPTRCDLYKCGECGTTLQAKKRSGVNVSSQSSAQETIAAPGKLLVPSRECSLNEKTSSADFNVVGNSNRGQLVPFILSDEEQETESDIYNLSHRRHRMSSKGCSNSNKTNHSEIEEVNEGELVEELKEEFVCALDEDGYNDRSASTLKGVTSEKKNTEVDLEGVKEFISESDGENANKGKSVVVGVVPNKVEITESNDSEGEEELNGGNLSSEGAEEEFSSALEEDTINYKSAPVGESLEVKITEINRAEELNDGKLFEEAEHTPNGEDSKNNPSVIDGAKPEVGTTESASTTIRSSTEEENILYVMPDKLEGPPANLVSSHKQKTQAQKDVHRGFDRVKSVNIRDSTKLIDHSSELSDIVGKLSKSPTARSSHAYDGSLSSYDVMDERSTIQYSGSFDNTHTIANDVSEGRTRKGKGLVQNLLYGDFGTQRQSHLSNAKHHAKKDSSGNQNKVVEEATRNGHRRWKSTKRDDFPPKIPFHRSGSRSYYESGNSSNHMHDEIHRSSSFLSHESFEETDQEKTKLFNMIHKLQDQLNRTLYTSGEANGRLSKGVAYKGNRISAYHNNDFNEGRRFSHGLDYPLCNGRCSHGVNWHQRHNKSSRIPYSAEATRSAFNVDHSCYHCRSQERHFSADISPHGLFQHERLQRSCAGRDCCSFSNHSYPSSPQWFTGSKLSPMYGRETKPDDQRRRVPELSRYLREKRNLVAKRHHRPVAGGAPFVTCHKCLNLLQLPADFLLFKRACQLKCGECSEVLKFSLHGSHIDLFSSDNAIGSPSRDLNDQSQLISSSSLPSASHAKYYCYSPAEAISYYDDYSLSISKSYSSEGEPISLAHSHQFHGSEYDNPRVSRDIFEPSTEKEKVAPRYSSARKSLVETDESAIFPTNMSGSRKLASEMRARPPQKSSSLHLLMGYSSPSQVIRGSRTSFEGD